MGTKKNFVIDTNVILHDYNCLKNFQENDIYLPIVVLEELDKFKKGNEQIKVSKHLGICICIPKRNIGDTLAFLSAVIFWVTLMAPSLLMT